MLQPIRIFDGSFCGTVLYDNPEYQSPNLIRRHLKFQKALELKQRQEQKEERAVKEEMVRAVKLDDPIGEIFDTDQRMEEEADEDEKPVVRKKKKAAKLVEMQILGKTIRKKKAEEGKDKEEHHICFQLMNCVLLLLLFLNFYKFKSIKN